MCARFTAMVVATAGTLVPISTTGAQRAQAADTSRAELGRVTVTATRAPISVLQTPLAVTVISVAALRNTRGFGLDEVLNQVPGVLAQSRSGNQDVRIVIRGFGARGAGDRSNAGTSRGIRILLDGIPETEPDGRTSFDDIDLSSAQRIDVVRSNASAIWGNAAGGLINVSTVPAIDAPSIAAQAMSGSFGLLRNIVRANSQLGNGSAYGSLASTSLDGWRANSSSRRSLLSIGLLSSPNDRTDFAAYAVGANNLFHVPGPLTRAQAEQNPTQANATYLARRERRYNRTGRIGLTFAQRPSEANEFSAMVFANPKYLQRSERGTFRDFTRYHLGGNIVFGNRSRLFDRVSNHLVVGADEAYQDGAILFYSLSPTADRGSELRDNKREGANNFGVFIQDMLSIGDNVVVTLGARYDNITYHSQSFFDPSINGSKAFEGISPKLGVTYRLSAARTLYANIGGGVEAPAGNETDPAGTFGQDTIYAINPLLDPIRSTTYEVGTKHIMSLDGTGFWRELSYDLALYDTEVRNEIVPYRGGRFYFTAGRARRKGVELAISAGGGPGLSVRTAMTFSQNRYVDYRVDSVHYDPARSGIFADYSGNAVVGVPAMNGTVSVALSPEPWRGTAISLALQGVGRYYADDANALTIPGYGVVSATISLGRAAMLGSSGVGLTGFASVNNLFDRPYIGSAFLNPDLVNGVPVAFEPGLPRNVVVSFSLSRIR